MNERSRIYHFAGTRDYGHTKRGAHMCEADAQAARQPRGQERKPSMIRWLRRWRERDDRHLIKSTASPLPDIDPIEELDRLISEAQEWDAEAEGRFERLSRSSRRIVNRTDSIGTPRMGGMQYRVQFLDRRANVIRELTADARNAIGAIALLADIDWPAHAITIRVLDADGREAHSVTKGDSQR